MPYILPSTLKTVSPLLKQLKKRPLLPSGCTSENEGFQQSVFKSLNNKWKPACSCTFLEGFQTVTVRPLQSTFV